MRVRASLLGREGLWRTLQSVWVAGRCPRWLGSITVAQSLLAQGLVDELCLAVGRVVDPVGPRLFAQVGELRELTLVAATPTASGSVWLRYRING